MTPAHRLDRDNRVEGLRAMREGLLLADQADKARDANESLRKAVDSLTEAFLEDRLANRDLFVVAHRVGAIIEERFGCTWTFDEVRNTYTHDCPIMRLHSRMGVSVGGNSESECSICGAGAFECDHVPGQYYDGQRCISTIINFEIDHFALTRNPDFAYTFGLFRSFTRTELEEHLGQTLREGQVPLSHHCQVCYGRTEAKPEDLDPSSWPDIREQ